MPDIIDLEQKLSLIADHWHPRVVGALNNHHVKLVRLLGEFIWHRHVAEDELFLVLRGSLVVRLRDHDLQLKSGQLVIVPRGVEHMPVAEGEVHVLLLEPESTTNTGDARGERPVSAEWI